MNLYNMLKKSKKGNKNATYEIIKDFNNTLIKLSKQLNYEEAKTDLIIELLKLIKNIDINKFQKSEHKQIAKYIHICLKKEC